MNECKCENGHFWNNEQNAYLTAETLLKKQYLVKKILANGGFGNTYEGRDLLTRKYIFIKEYCPSNLTARNIGQNDIFIADNSKEIFKRGLGSFLREANRLKSLSDISGALNIVDCFEENNTGYIIMEMIDGTVLSDVIKANGKISYNIAKDIISNILRTMYQIHSRNIIHCNLSPNNIYLTKECEIKVIDFSAMYDKMDPDSQGDLLTKSYSAIEQYSSNRQIGTWTDVYAIASIFYYMITNIEVPYCAERLLDDQLKNPSVYCDEIPQKDAVAIMHALAIQPRIRTKDVKGFAEELEIDLTNIKEIRLDEESLLSNVELERKIEIERECNFIDQIDKNAKKGALYGCGIDIDEIRDVDIEKIPQEKQAFNMLLNQFKTLDEEHQVTLSELNNIKRQTESRKFAAIIITIAEIVTSIGISVFSDSVFAGSATFVAGVIMTALGLYMTYKK